MYNNESGNDYISLSILKVFEGFSTEEKVITLFKYWEEW